MRKSPSPCVQEHIYNLDKERGSSELIKATEAVRGSESVGMQGAL